MTDGLLWADWYKVGRKVIAQLPKEEREPFIKWLEEDNKMVDLYMAYPGKVLDLWNKSVRRYDL